MKGTGRLMRRDWLAAAALIVVSVGLRVPFRSQYAYHWDSAEFSLAISEYNVAISQPHAPGYFLYVMLGRVVNWFVGDPHASLVWMSVGFGSALVGMMYLLGTTMFERRSGVAAALMAMTSPQSWFHSCVALTYVVDAFLVCLIVWWCWRASQRGGGWWDAVVIGGALAMAGGVRQQTVPGLLPLVLYTFWKFRSQRAAKLAVAGAVAMLGASAWFVPMAAMSGGVTRYLEVVQRFSWFLSRNTVSRNGVEALLRNVTFVAAFLWIGLLAAAVLLAGGLFYRTFRVSLERRRVWDREHGQAMRFVAWWVMPMLVLTTVVGIADQPGHVFSYLPAFWLLAGVVAVQMQHRWMMMTTVGIVCAVNAVAFLAWPKAWGGMLFGMGRTAREIRQHDELMGRTMRLVRSQFRPAETLICHADEHFMFGLRQLQLHLPEYDQYLFPWDWAMVSPTDKPMLGVRHGRLEFMTGPSLDDKKVVLLAVPAGCSVGMFADYVDLTESKEVSGSGGCLYALPVAAVRSEAVERAIARGLKQQTTN